MWIAPTNPRPARVPRPPEPIYKDALGLWADIPGFTAFAEEVADALDGRDLRYSQRLKLLKRADHFGIRRFDANLIIAMVQHRMPHTQQPEDSRKSSWLPTVTAFALTQGLIVAAAYWLLVK
jgi:hypothetical protein